MTQDGDDVNDTKSLEESYVNLWFTPHSDVYKSQYANIWHLRGRIVFSCRLGHITRALNLEFSVQNDQLESVRAELKELSI